MADLSKDLPLTFRIAEPSDFDEIIRLSNEVFPSGNDYLQHKINKWLQMNNLAILLAFVDEKLVGLQACFIVDEGQTFVRQAMRFAPDLQGRGLSRKLSQAMDAYVRKNFPSVLRLRFTNYVYRECSSATKMVLELDNLGYRVEHLPLDPHMPCSVKNAELVSCSKKYFSEVILSRAFSHKLFPLNVLIVDWCPFEALCSNIDYILQDDDLLLTERCDEYEMPRSFSFGRLSPKAKVKEWIVSVYTDDPRLFEAHVIQHYYDACKIIKEEFTFVSFHDKGLRNLGKKTLGEKLNLQHDEFYMNESLFLYERDFGMIDSGNVCEGKQL